MHRAVYLDTSSDLEVVSTEHEHGLGHWTDLERLKRLDHPERLALMPHAPILAALDLNQGMHVADIGAGLGYFAFPMSVAVRREGRVFAVDPSPAAREELKRRVQSAKVHNIIVQDGTAARVALADRSLDRVLWHALFHELPNLDQSVAEMARVLKHGGLFVVADWLPGASEWGPHQEERWPRSKAEKLVSQSGPFRTKEVFEPGPVTWGIVFERV